MRLFWRNGYADGWVIVIYCDLHSDGDGFTCTQCGWTYHKQVHHGCPKSPQGRAGRLAAILHELTELRAKQPDWHRYHARSDVDLERILGRCFEWCNAFSGGQCTERGTDCKARRGWLKRLSCVGLRECERWAI